MKKINLHYFIVILTTFIFNTNILFAQSISVDFKGMNPHIGQLIRT